MEYYSNFKKYDDKGRRLAIFAREIYPSEFESLPALPDSLEIFILRCSKKDQFCRKTARLVYETWLENKTVKDVVECEDCTYHPEIQVVELEDKLRPKWSFLMWCKRNFKKLYKSVSVISNLQNVTIYNPRTKHPFEKERRIEITSLI